MRTMERTDLKWAHPESASEGWYAIPMPDMRAYVKQDPKKTDAMMDEMCAQMAPAITASETFDWKEYAAFGCVEEPEAPSVKVMVGTPKKHKKGKKLPVVFGIAGGGLIFGGRAEMCAAAYPPYLEMAGVDHIEVTFSYRLAPGAEYPAAINDCHAAYQWMIDHAEELDIDTDRIVIYGISTGGHLALCTTFRIKRYQYCGAPMPRGVVIQVPVMDDCALTHSSGFFFDNEDGTKAAWDAELTQCGYKAYLGEHFGDPRLLPEAVPNRATAEDVKGFPPLWVPAEAEFEPGRDSLLHFAQLLYNADIFCDLHVWGGTSHQGFTAKETDFAKRCNAVFAGAIRDALTYDFRRPWLNEADASRE